ncbi:hypothetical protein [Pyxidicoccus trucidator]|uniref:hypothetical protein n=1 Tax=Pyxidicoccus trucidator TaxID=2709662 RepID=UPI0013DA41F2|nr:hypothetical protein [Pyxidicoccus trucidator]
MDIQVRLHQGNWWVWVLGEWIGYYPRCKDEGFLFSSETQASLQAAGAHADPPKPGSAGVGHLADVRVRRQGNGVDSLLEVECSAALSS